MAKKNKTYYVSKNNSWHTYDFLERRKMDPKWRGAYLSAKEQRKKEAIIYVFLSVILVVLLAAAFIFLNFYDRKTNIDGANALTPVSSVNSSLESNNTNQIETITEQKIIQDEQDFESEGNTEDYYYEQLRDAWQKEQDYIDSISDPEIKVAVQTPEGAVNVKQSELLMEYPNDKQLIDNA